MKRQDMNDLLKAAREMRQYIDRMATRQMRTHCAFDEAMSRWQKAIDNARTVEPVTKIEIEKLAVSFRVAPSAPGHKHVDVYDAIERIGGQVAILYGIFVATPFRQRWIKRDRGLAVADALDRAADILPE